MRQNMRQKEKRDDDRKLIGVPRPQEGLQKDLGLSPKTLADLNDLFSPVYDSGWILFHRRLPVLQ